MRELLESAKNVEKGLKNAEICFNNLTRPYSSICFYKDAALGKFDYYRHCTDFFKVLHDAINKSEKTVIPYIKPVCSKPRITSFPMVYKDYLKLLYDIESY